MKRLFFLLPDADTCRRVVADLENDGIPERHLHVIANLGQPIQGLPEAGLWLKSDVSHGIQRGIGLGGIAGLLGGVLIVTFPPAGLLLAGSTVLAAGATAAGAGFGALVAALMSSHEYNHDLAAFETAIRNGEILLLVDVPKHNVESTKAMILSHVPDTPIHIAVRQ